MHSGLGVSRCCEPHYVVLQLCQLLFPASFQHQNHLFSSPSCSVCYPPHRPPMALPWPAHGNHATTPCLTAQTRALSRLDPSCQPFGSCARFQLPAMGSLGWAPCYWCGWWQENMYIPDGVDHPLCSWCLWHSEGPPQPDARTRLYEFLVSLQPQLPERAAWEIVEFTHHWHEP